MLPRRRLDNIILGEQTLLLVTVSTGITCGLHRQQPGDRVRAAHLQPRTHLISLLAVALF